MRTLVTIAVVAGVAGSVGCPPPPSGRLHNHTTETVRYCSRWRCTPIPPGDTLEIRIGYAGQFRFALQIGDRELSYAVDHSIPWEYARRDDDSGCPGCPRFFFQLEPDLRIFLLGPDVAPPASSFGEQPAGFPLAPLQEAG